MFIRSFVCRRRELTDRVNKVDNFSSRQVSLSPRKKVGGRLGKAQETVTPSLEKKREDWRRNWYFNALVIYL